LDNVTVVKNPFRLLDLVTHPDLTSMGTIPDGVSRRNSTSEVRPSQQNSILCKENVLTPKSFQLSDFYGVKKKDCKNSTPQKQTFFFIPSYRSKKSPLWRSLLGESSKCFI